MLVGVVAQASGVQEPFVYAVVRAGLLANSVIFAFNLLPILPLDGGRVVAGLLPMRASIAYSRIEPYGFVIVLALMFLVPGFVNALWIAPVKAFMQMLLALLFSPFA